MGFYLGNESKQFILNGIVYYVRVGQKPLPIKGVILKLSDGQVIKDIEGRYVTLKESE